MTELECPRCKSKKINQFMEPSGGIWCENCGFEETQKNLYNPFKVKENPNKTLDEMQEVRARNNVNWIDILKLAFKYAPDEAKKIMANINAHDKQISALCDKLAK